MLSVTFVLLCGPVSQDQTTTVLFFRHRCVVLKFQDHTMTGHCPVLGGPCLVLKFQEISGNFRTRERPNSVVVVWSWSLSGPVTPGNAWVLDGASQSSGPVQFGLASLGFSDSQLHCIGILTRIASRLRVR